MVPVTRLPSHLSDLCLGNIFARVPLSDLLRSVRVVFPNWYRVVPTELRRRREVVLVGDYKKDVESIRESEMFQFGSDLMVYVRREDGSPWVRLRSLDQICFNALLLCGGVLTESFTTSLMDTLPTITHLTIVQSNISESPIIPVLQQLVRLLNHYRNRLISTLKLDLTFQHHQITADETQNNLVTNSCTALFGSINQLESLRNLTLNIYYLDNIPSISPRLSILSRLDTFTSNYADTWLMDTIRQYATGNVRIDVDPYLPLEEMIELNPQLASKFSSVCVENDLSPTHYLNMRLLGTRFSSLSRLTLSVRTMPMTMLARCLSPLPELVHLRIDTFFLLEDEFPAPEYVQLPSVRLLSLEMYTRSHLYTERLHLAQIFPNLQVLSLDQHVLSCDVCEYGFIQMRGLNFDVARVEQCCRLARQPFRLCSNLHTIKLEENSQFPHDLITRDQF